MHHNSPVVFLHVESYCEKDNREEETDPLSRSKEFSECGEGESAIPYHPSYLAGFRESNIPSSHNNHLHYTGDSTHQDLYDLLGLPVDEH